MDRIKVAGIVFAKEDLAEIRETVIGWRAKSMDQWPEAIPFTTDATYLIGILAEVIKQYPDQEDET
jgi:hypothetical protein